jgi:DNA processing protein
MTPARLDVLLNAAQPSVATAMIRGGAMPTGLVRKLLEAPGLVAAWREDLRRRPPDAVWLECERTGVQVLRRGGPGYPAVLQNDPQPVPVLFVRGSFDRLTSRRAGVIGTRHATGSGRDVATTLGRDLAVAGVHVVSGLARGIDGCAHRGALSVDGAAPIGVVATGLDVVYPREHAALHAQVAERGVLVSEFPPGTPPAAHRFPLRNRIIAALSEVLVVVESRQRGGSLITAGQAKDRGVTVMAVPGAVRNASAHGTNSLLRDGCPVVTDVDDVLVALGLDSRRTGAVAYDPRPRPSRGDRELLALCCEPRTLDQLTLLSGSTLVECAMALARLETAGWVAQINGWYESVEQQGSAQ